LSQLPVRAADRHLHWVEEPDRLVLCLAPTPAARHVTVDLEPGVREMVRDCVPSANGAPEIAAVGDTCCEEFDRQAGRRRQRAEDRSPRPLESPDPGRPVCLEWPHRHHPDLAFLLADLAPTTGWVPAAPPPAPCPDGLPPVEFVPVPPLEADKRRTKGDRPRPGSETTPPG